jgi:hypothetical protein
MRGSGIGGICEEAVYNQN